MSRHPQHPADDHPFRILIRLAGNALGSMAGKFLLLVFVVAAGVYGYYTLSAQGSAYFGISLQTNPKTDSAQGGLVGWWTFDGKDTNWATGQAQDRSGNGNARTRGAHEIAARNDQESGRAH